MNIAWSNPHSVSIESGAGLLYFISVRDDAGAEYRYIGKTTRGRGRLREYQRNIERIFEGKPRRTTSGQEHYRAVHFALAKAVQNGWAYKFYPLENTSLENLSALEKQRIIELDCSLNTGRSWDVRNFCKLHINDLL